MFAGLAGTRPPIWDSASVEKRMISKLSSGFRLARQKASAFFACSSFAPAIDPEVSRTKQMSFGWTAPFSMVIPGEASSRKYPSLPGPEGAVLARRSIPRGLPVRESRTLKSVSGHTSRASHPTTARRSPSRRTSAGCVGQYTLFSRSLPSIVSFTDTSRTGAELNFSVFRGYTYSTRPPSSRRSCV